MTGLDRSSDPGCQLSVHGHPIAVPSAAFWHPAVCHLAHGGLSFGALWACFWCPAGVFKHDDVNIQLSFVVAACTGCVGVRDRIKGKMALLLFPLDLEKNCDNTRIGKTSSFRDNQ